MIKIIDYIKKFWLIIGVLVVFECCEIVAPQEAHAGFNSLLERESRVNYSGILDFVIKLLEDVYMCLYKDVIYNPSQLNNTCIPRILTSDSNYENDCAASGDNAQAVSFVAIGTIVFLSLLITTIASFFIPIFGSVLFIAGFVLFAATIKLCLGTYVLAPHEYINGLLNRVQCKQKGNKIVNIAPEALILSDVPFFYNCADQSTDKNALAAAIANNDTSGLDAENGYGNMNDPSMPYCQGGSEKYALNNLKGEYGGIDVSEIGVGSIIVGIVGGNLWDPRDQCDVKQDKFVHKNMNQIRTGGWTKDGSEDKIVPYYRLHSGKIQLCAANISRFLGARNAGCTYIAPPIEASSIDAGFTDQTRCSYFLSTRSDLHSLGRSINANAKAGNGEYSSVGLFLQSDLHIMSTIMGCMQDLLIKVVVGGKDDVNESFLYQIQNTLKGLIYVVLILYVSILGIKIMSKPNPPEMGEVVMYVIKFALVFSISGLGGQSLWYNNNTENNNTFSPGLYVLLLDAMNSLAGIVLESTNSLAPINMCYLDYGDGRNILSQRSFPATPAQGTQGGLIATATMFPKEQNKLVLSTWDFVDCKLASYLNLNSCNYTISGMTSMWLLSVAIFMPSIFLLSLVIIIFGMVLLATMFRFIHLTIVSMFALTILVLVSPIISCFILFDFTKDTFNNWFKMLLGYVLYPAMVFTFLGLMITTFDAIFYGQLINPQCITSSDGCSIKDICGTSRSDNNSLYCAVGRAVKEQMQDKPIAASMCNVPSGAIFQALIVDYQIKIGPITIFKIYALSERLFVDFFTGFMKMSLFMLLFYYMTDAVLGFFETLLSISGIASMAPDYVKKMKDGVIRVGTMIATSGASERGQNRN